MPPRAPQPGRSHPGPLSSCARGGPCPLPLPAPLSLPALTRPRRTQPPLRGGRNQRTLCCIKVARQVMPGIRLAQSPCKSTSSDLASHHFCPRSQQIDGRRLRKLHPRPSICCSPPRNRGPCVSASRAKVASGVPTGTASASAFARRRKPDAWHVLAGVPWGRAPRPPKAETYPQPSRITPALRPPGRLAAQWPAP